MPQDQDTALAEAYAATRAQLIHALRPGAPPRDAVEVAALAHLVDVLGRLAPQTPPSFADELAHCEEELAKFKRTAARVVRAVREAGLMADDFHGRFEPLRAPLDELADALGPVE